MLALLLSSVFLAATPTPATPPQVPADQMAAAAGEAETAPKGASSLMIINPKDRSDDLVKAYGILTTERSAATVFIRLSTGEEINNIISVRPMPAGTLIILRYNTPSGIAYRTVGVDEIEGIIHK